MRVNTIADFWMRVQRGDGCWTWIGGLTAKGYGQFRLRGSYLAAHRLAWELTNGPIPDGLGVLHRCDNPPCVNPAHLFLGTHADNMHDMHEKGRRVAARGSAHGLAKLTESDVLAIRAEYKAGARQKDLSEKYGVQLPAIGKIVRRTAWAHI